MRKCSWSVLLLITALAGCGGSNQAVINNTISPTPTEAVDAGQSVTFTSTVNNDPSNSGVTWSLSGAGTLSNATSTTVVYTAPATVTAAAATASVTAVPVKNSLFAAATQILLAPALAFTSSTSLTAATINAAYTNQLAVTGGSGTLTYTVVNGTLPTGLTLSSSGLISGTPTTVGLATFAVSVTDAAATPATVTRQFTLNVTATTLKLTTTSLSNGVVSKAYSAQFAASGGVTPYTWTVASGGLPSGLTLSSSGLLSGMPTVAGTYSFTVKVADAEAVPQTVTSGSFTVSIYSLLSITTTTLPSGSLKNTYSATLASSGGSGAVTWSVASGSVPTGLTLSSAGVLSGTPMAAGTYTFTAQVADSGNPQQTATMSYTVTIVTSTLAITSTSPLPQATVGVSYSTTLTSSGGNAPVTWALAAGSTLPANLMLSSAGVISGTATTAGTYTFTVQATDSTPYTVSQTFSLTVIALAPLAITSTTVPAGNIGTAYSTTLTATGGATPYTWSLASGTLPQGLTLSTGGVLSGTPLAAGTYTFTAQVKDSEATPATATQSYTLTIGTTLAAGTGNSRLTGNYAFLIKGFRNATTSGTVAGFAAIGNITANGSGTITGGIQDLNTPGGVTTSIALTGTYTLGSDGRGLMVLTGGSTTNVYAISASQVSGGVAQFLGITEFDNSTAASGTSNASGFAKLQTASTFVVGAVKGAYAFGFSGESPCATCATSVKLGPLAAAGVFTADGVSAISAGTEDAGAYGTNYSGVTFTGTFTVPSSTTGRGTIHVTNTGTLFSAPPTDYTYVIVNAGELLLMSNDTHATVSLLSGDARLQTVTTYSAASLTGTLIGYESQGNGGNGATTAPTALNAILSRFAITASGTGTLAQDANRAGTETMTAATATTYTTGTTGRTVLAQSGTNIQVLYPYTGNAGFALDLASTTGYPGLITYEQQVASISPYPPLLTGSYGAFTLPTAAPATDASGTYMFALSTGGVDASLNGTLNTTLDSSAPVGTLALGTTNSLIFLEDTTGRITTNTQSSTTLQGVVYAITSTRAVGIPATAAATTTPTVTVLQQ